MLRRASVPLWLVGGLVILFLMAPIVVVVVLAFSSSEFFVFPPPDLSLRWFDAFFSDPRWTDALARSVRVGLAAAGLSVILGTSAALGIARGGFPGRDIFRGLLLIPLVVPYVVLAAGLFVLFAQIRLLNTEVGLVVAHTVVALPFVVVAVGSSLRAARRELELAAMSLGARPAQTFRRVTFPLILPGIAAGGILAFITSFDEVVLAIFLAGVHSTTLPLRMWEGATREVSPVLPAVSTILIGASIVLLAAAELVRAGAARRSKR